MVRMLAALVALSWSLTACDGSDGFERRNYAIELDAGHVHIFSETTLDFSVVDLDTCTDPDDTATCATVPGLDVTAFYRGPHASSTREYALEPGVLEDNGDGTYTWYRSFNDLGAHTVGIWFDDVGERYHASFPLETSRAGGERYFCDVDDPPEDYAYQIRWNASAGHIHADGESVEFYIELKRSWNATLDTEQPWRNKFDHLRPGEIEGGVPTVTLMAGESEISLMAMSYDGTGLYVAPHTFSEGEDGDYWLRVRFADDLGCDLDSEKDRGEYAFRVAATH